MNCACSAFRFGFLGVLLLQLLWAAPATASPGARPPRPNILFILTDDFGYGDLGVLWQNQRGPGLPRHSTPNLDRLAADGLIFHRHYCPAPVCAPSRASLLLGVHQGHANVRDNQFDKALENNHTLATVLREAGYATVAIGKYGLQGNGANPAQWPAYPTKRGFDYYFGYVRHKDGHEHYPKEGLYDGPKEVWDNNTNIAEMLDKCYTADLWTARAKKWIVDHNRARPEQPFFMYLAYDTPHAVQELPAQPYPSGGGTNGGVRWLGTPGHMINTASGTIDSWVHPDYTNATYDDDQNPATPQVPWPEVDKRYATAIRRIDSAVADLRELLAQLGIATNTLFVFTSDNGPSIESYLPNRPLTANFFDSYGPFDGIKRDSWEGGIRMPTLACWPGHIRPGKSSDSPSAFWDWMPTFAELAGVPSPARSDGVSLVPTLTGIGTQKPSTIYIEYFHNGRTPEYVEFAQPHRGRRRNQMQVLYLNGYQGVRYNIHSASDDFEIYDVLRDTREATNLASAFPTLQGEMKARALQLRRPDPGASRPYDNELVPAVPAKPLRKGFLQYAVYPGAWPWVPNFENFTPSNMGWAAGPDVASRAESKFGMKLTGYLRVPEDGSYTFYLESDSGALMRIHDAVIIDDDFNHDGSECSANIRLQAGLHPLTIYYRHNGGTPRLRLEYSGPNFSRHAVPDEAFAAANE
jgi:arylsulfatase A-like enzyme